MSSPSAPSIDPTALALLSIFGGAAVTILAGFIGAGLQQRREHRRWLRERRLEAFIAVRTWADRANDVLMEAQRASDALREGEPGSAKWLKTARAKREQVLNDSPAAFAPLEVLGPDAVNAAIGDLLPHVMANDANALAAQWVVVMRLMRDSLGI